MVSVGWVTIDLDCHCQPPVDLEKRLGLENLRHQFFAATLGIPQCRVTAWLRRRNMLRQLRVTRHVQQMLAGDLKTEIQARLPLKEAARGLEQYASNMTGGKILLLPLTKEAE